MNKNHDSNIGRRPHLTKEQRLPNCYKEVEKIVKSVKSCQANFKTILAQSRLRGSQFKKVYKLSLNILKYYNYIEKIVDKLELLKKEKFLRKEIAVILIYELIFGNGSLPGESKAVSIVRAYENELMDAHQEFQICNTDFIEMNEIYIPRYARVHTLVTSVACVINDLQNYGFKQILFDVDLSEENFFQVVKSLEKGNFLVDFHFKDILVFAQAENLVELELYKKGHIFLQDKASYIPVHALNPEPGSTVLDACAAPGMKSAHIASKMKNKGILIACEIDESRFESLKETLEYGSVKISRTLCTDFKLINPNDETYYNVDYILLDPSCSGSGMVNRMDSITDTEDSKTKERLMKLAGFQIILLKHALKFPLVKRVVYSTCSVHEEENEYVVQEALNAFGRDFRLVPVMSEWFDRGSENYECGKMCLRTVPEKHLTNGFFVAVFERIEAHECRIKKFFVKGSENKNPEKSDDISHKSIDLVYKSLKMESPESQQEINYKKNKKGETNKEYSMNNLYEGQEKKYNYFSREHNNSEKNKGDFYSKELEQSNISNSSEIHYKTSDGTQNYDHYVDSTTHENCTKEMKGLKAPEFSKKKRKERKHSSSIQLQSVEQNQEELIITSELQQKCENSVGLEEIPKIYYAADKSSNISISDKKHKHKKHLISDNACEKLGVAYETSSLKRKHKKRKKEIDDPSLTQQQCNNSNALNQSAGDYQCFSQNIANIIHDSFTQETKMLECSKLNNDSKIVVKDEIFDDSNLTYKKKKCKRKRSSEENTYISVPDTEQVSENIYPKCDKNSSNSSHKVKKHKKHSKRSDFSESQTKLETYSLVKSENLSFSQNEDMTEEQYLGDNYSKCKKSKKHANASNGAVFPLDKNPKCTSSDIMNKDSNKTVPLDLENISIYSPNQQCSHVKKKSKKHKNNETNKSSDFQYSNINAQDADTVQDFKRNLLHNDIESVTSVENDCIERKKRKKHKKHLLDNICVISDIKVEKKVESFHSEIGSKHCKIRERSTEISVEHDNLSVLKESETILFSSSKKKKKDKKQKITKS